jgi:hypothetical protein
VGAHHSPIPLTIPANAAARTLVVDPQSLTKAQEDLKRLQGQAFYEEGQLIAVQAR